MQFKHIPDWYQKELPLQLWSSQFEVQYRLKQGNLMSLTLFNLALKIVNKDRWVNHDMEPNDKNVILAYADDIIILGNTKNDVVTVTKKQIKSL